MWLLPFLTLKKSFSNNVLAFCLLKVAKKNLKINVASANGHLQKFCQIVRCKKSLTWPGGWYASYGINAALNVHLLEQ